MQKLILAIDDDKDILKILKRYLENEGFSISTANNGDEGFEMVEKLNPDLIILDVMMPGLNGYEISTKLQNNKEHSCIPVIFLSALGGKENKLKAFACGAVDYLEKPFDKNDLLNKVKKHLQTKPKWTTLQKDSFNLKGSEIFKYPGEFREFKKFLIKNLQLHESEKSFEKIKAKEIYLLSPIVDINNIQMAQSIAEFTKLPYLPYIDPESIQLGVLPTAFCNKYNVVVISTDSNQIAFVLSNPFDWELVEFLSRMATKKIMITEPENISPLFEGNPSDSSGSINIIPKKILPSEIVNKTENPTIYISENILIKAIQQRASDIHIEPKEEGVTIRLRIDGDMQPAFLMKHKTGVKLISRFKVLSS